ncbi:MAG TPA: hypothetical protein VGB20_07450 [bacterium]
MKNDVIRRRNILISAFVVVWTAVFQYETLRYKYLGPWLGRDLPKIRLLFPPAGWIMFYRIDPAYGMAEVYGVRPGGPPELLDPHAMFETRALGYDNIRRNVLVGVLTRDAAAPFCRYLHRKFPAYASFSVVYAEYPDLIGEPARVRRATAYRCEPGAP